MSSVLLKPSAITSILSYAERGSERSRANPQERLQNHAAGTAGTAPPQGAGSRSIKLVKMGVDNLGPKLEVKLFGTKKTGPSSRETAGYSD